MMTPAQRTRLTELYAAAMDAERAAREARNAWHRYMVELRDGYDIGPSEMAEVLNEAYGANRNRVDLSRMIREARLKQRAGDL